MRKISWIYSVNADGVNFIGSRPTVIGKGVKTFQEKIQKGFAPEWQINFVSLDINNSEILLEDVVVYNELDKAYLSEEIKKKGLAISYTDITTQNVTAIKEKVTTFYQNS